MWELEDAEIEDTFNTFNAQKAEEHVSKANKLYLSGKYKI